MDLIKLLKSSDLKIDLNTVKKLKNSVKNRFEKINESIDILSNFPYLNDDISKRIKNNTLIQQGRIVESIIVQIISNKLNCVYCGNGVFENEQYIIKQDGGSGKSDLIIKDKSINKDIIFEIKEPIAYGKSCGFIYNDKGTPIDFTSKDNIFKEYIETLFEKDNILNDYNILENIGHNKLFNISDIITNTFDYIISYDKYGNLIMLTTEEYKKIFDFKIEIRSCGRNYRKVFTPNKLNIINNLVLIELSDLIDIKQRGGSNSSRYKYIKNNATFTFKKSDIINDDNKLFIHINKINQHLGEVSIQHFRRSNHVN